MLRSINQLPGNVQRSHTLHNEMGPEMVDHVLKFFESQNVRYTHLQVKGFNRIRNRVMKKIFDGLTIIQYADVTPIVFGKGLRRRGAPSLKSRHRPKGAIKVAGTRMRDIKAPIADHVAFFGA